ncbi:hypothetical protein RUND412_005360 [Rhizina undulata]
MAHSSNTVFLLLLFSFITLKAAFFLDNFEIAFDFIVFSASSSAKAILCYLVWVVTISVTDNVDASFILAVHIIGAQSAVFKLLTTTLAFFCTVVMKLFGTEAAPETQRFPAQSVSSSMRINAATTRTSSSFQLQHENVEYCRYIDYKFGERYTGQNLNRLENLLANEIAEEDRQKREEMERKAKEAAFWEKRREYAPLAAADKDWKEELCDEQDFWENRAPSVEEVERAERAQLELENLNQDYAVEASNTQNQRFAEFTLSDLKKFEFRGEAVMVMKRLAKRREVDEKKMKEMAEQENSQQDGAQ